MRETSAARFYELMVITAPDGTPEELVETVEQVNGYITSAGGTILRSNYDSPWGRRRLAYPIRHHSHDVRDGFYTLIHLEMAPDRVIDVERDLKLNDRLMRYLVLQLAGEPVFPEPEAEEGAGEATGSDGGAAEAPATPAAQSQEASEDSAEERRTVASTATEAPPAEESEPATMVDQAPATEDSGSEVEAAEAPEASESAVREEMTPVADDAKEVSDVTE